jgi:Fe-S-cluster containining protein
VTSIADAVGACRAEVAGLAAAMLPRARGEEDLAALATAVDAVVARALGRAEEQRPAPACRPGCAACCVLNVGTLAVEGAAVAVQVRRTVDAAGAAAFARRLLAAHDRVRWLEDRERIAARVACPLLDAAGRCSVHAARPLACRSVTSLDVGDCRRALDESDDAPPVVRMDLVQRVLYDEARAALGDALADAGLDARCRDVSGMAGAFLADPDLGVRWLAGGRVPLE